MRNFLTSAAIAALVLAAAAPVTALAQSTGERGSKSEKTLRGSQAAKPAARTPAKKPSAGDAKKKPSTADAKKKPAADAKKKPSAADAKKKLDAQRDDDDDRGTLSDQPSTGSMAKGPVKSEPGKSIKVEKGQNLISLARKLDVPRQTLIDENNLKAPYNVRVGQTLKLPGKRYYQVQSGDTLYSVARRFGTPAADLAAHNDFAMSKTIRAGQKLYLPGDAVDALKKTPAKPKETARPPVKETPKPATPKPSTLKPPAPKPSPEQTPAPASREPISPALAPETGLPDRPATVTPPATTTVTQPATTTASPPVREQRPATRPSTPQTDSGFQMTREAPVTAQPQRPGVVQRIPAPAATTTTQPTTTATPYTELGRNTPASRPRGYPAALPPSIAAVAPSSRNPIIDTTPAPTTGDVATAGRGRFIWPIRGEILTTFGPRGPGQRSDGLNIAAREGDPVRAAADGEVVYAGDQVPSFGNLVLIKHSGGWVTAYAHMGRITVKNRDRVAQGQQLGVAGATGAVTSPQVHFEIRYAPTFKDKAAPIDPLLVLPNR